MSRERKRALETLAQVNEVKADAAGNQRRYGSLVYNVPVLLRTAGLAQTIAFLVSRSDGEGKRLVKHLGARLGLGADPMKVFEKVAAASTAEYLAHTAEAIASADWYVRHVQAVLKVERTEEAETA